MKIEAVGNYRGYIDTWSVEESASGLPFVRIGIKATQEYRDEDWHNLPDEGDIEQRIFLMTKDGKTNKVGIDQLREACGFDPADGVRALYDASRFVQVAVSFATKARDYNGRTYFEVGYLNPWDRQPGGGKPADLDALANKLDGMLMGLSDGKPVEKPKKFGAETPF